MINQKYINYNQRAIVLPQTVNDEERSIEGVLTTETPVQVFDWNRWEVIREVLLIDGMEGADKVPLLDAHKRYNSDNVIGSCTDFKIETAEDGTRQLKAKNIFSSVEDKLFTKAKEGHIDSTSIGYMVSESDSIIIPPASSAEINGKTWANDDAKYDLVIRKKWTLKENSLVPIGADERAKLRAEMESQQNKAAENRAEQNKAGNDTDTKTSGDKKQIQNTSGDNLSRISIYKRIYKFLKLKK